MDNGDVEAGPSSSRESKFKRETRSSKKKGHKKSKLMESVEKVKPVFNAKDKTFQEYLDEYYTLDFEDIVGDTACRFKYRKTTPNSFGLTVEEVSLPLYSLIFYEKLVFYPKVDL